MKSIFKYGLEIKHDTQTILMPKGAEILDAQFQNKTICIWAIVDTEEDKEYRTFEVLGTGFTLSDAKKKHISTTQLEDFVFHVFEHIT